jgi:hypothetical protein
MRTIGLELYCVCSGIKLIHTLPSRSGPSKIAAWSNGKLWQVNRQATGAVKANIDYSQSAEINAAGGLVSLPPAKAVVVTSSIVYGCRLAHVEALNDNHGNNRHHGSHKVGVAPRLDPNQQIIVAYAIIRLEVRVQERSLLSSPLTS